MSTPSFNINSSLGQLRAISMAVAGPAMGKMFVVCPATDPNWDKLTQMFQPDADGVASFYTTLEAAYAAATTNQDDVILLAGNGTHTLAAPILWAKNRVHLVGVDGGVGRRRDMGAKVECATADTTSYVIKVTGTRNTFKNVKFIQSSTQATALSCMQDSGAQTLWELCQFTFGVATNYGLTTAHEAILGSDTATYLNCTFGTDVLLTTAARSVVLLKNDVTEFKSNTMIGCDFVISSSSSTALLLLVNSTGSVLFTNVFKDCCFIASVDASGGATLTNAIASAAGLVAGTIDLKDCASFHCTDLCAGVTDQVFHSGTVASAESGIAIQSA